MAYITTILELEIQMVGDGLLMRQKLRHMEFHAQKEVITMLTTGKKKVSGSSTQ